MGNKKGKYLILEFSEFTASQPNLAPSRDLQLSGDGYSRYMTNFVSAKRNLNTILTNVLKDLPANFYYGEDILGSMKDMQIERVIEKNGELYVYFTINIEDQEYYGCFEKFTSNINLNFDFFNKHPNIIKNDKLRIKITGILKKSVNNFFNVHNGKYKCLLNDDILKVVNCETGEFRFMNKNDKIIVETSDKDEIKFRFLDSVRGTVYKMFGESIYYFHYWFEPLQQKLKTSI